MSDVVRVPFDDEGGVLVAASDEMKEILKTVEKIAPTDATVLVTGASGTGKEVVARYIHYRSPRREGPFVAVNLAAIPDTLVESELFGHERGAFTGADRRRIGRFEAASGGTLFLDEIGALRKDLQAKLLRAVQERHVERLGGTAPVPIDVRIVAATNEDLRRAVAEGRFLEALYYRIHVVPIHLPPLRARRAEIPSLIAHFFDRLAERYDRPPPRLTPEAMQRMTEHDWPGNVRELENVCERILVLHAGEGEVRLEDLPERVRGGARAGEAPPDVPLRTLAEVEAEAIARTLEATGGNLSESARILGVTRKTLRDKVRRHGLYPPPK